MNDRKHGQSARTAHLGIESLERRDCLAAAGEEVFLIPGETGDKTAIFDWTSREASYNDELLLIRVDDQDGTINSIAPGAAGYTQAALLRADVVFMSGENAGAYRELSVNAGDWYMLGIVQNNTRLNAYNQGGNGSIKTFFSIVSANTDNQTDHFRFTMPAANDYRGQAEDLTGGGDNDFNDVVFSMRFTDASEINGDLAVHAGNGDVYNESVENRGIVIGRNSDNDDNDATIDLNDAAVSGENDLRTITLYVANAESGSEVSLKFSSQLKIWRNADRTGPVVNESTRFDAIMDTVLYVEGFSATSQHGMATIDFRYHAPNSTDVVVLDRARFTVIEPDLKTVDFGALQNMFHAVSSDFGGQTYTSKQFQNANTGDNQDIAANRNENPVAFTRGATATTQVEIKLRSNVARMDTSDIKIRGRGFRKEGDAARAAVEGFDFEAGGTLNAGMLTFANGPAQAAGTIANEVDAIKNLEIDWTVSFDGGKTWLDAGTSRNPTYVTYAAPANVNANTKLYHSILDIGATATKGLSGAGGATLEKAIEAADLLWNSFKDREVKNVDGDLLTYYSAWTDVQTNAVNLVRDSAVNPHDGDCVAFSTLFIYALQDLGFSNAQMMRITPKLGGDGQFNPDSIIVGKQNYTRNGEANAPIQPANGRYINISQGPAAIGAGDAYNWVYSQVTPVAQVKGQGDTDPPQHFNGHELVVIGDMVYDPSYGAQGNYGRFEITDAALGIKQFLAHFQNEVLGGVFRSVVQTDDNDQVTYRYWDIAQPGNVDTNNANWEQNLLLKSEVFVAP